MPPPTLSYGLNLAKSKSQKPSLGSSTSQKRKKTIFDDSDSEKEGDQSKYNGIEITTLGGLSSGTDNKDKKNNDEQPPAKRRAGEKGKPDTNSSKPQTGQRDYRNLSNLHSSKKHADTAADIDPSIYDYDAIYDSIHTKSKSKSKSKSNTPANDDSASKGPKYMGSLLRSAEVRKRDQLRARDKLLAREREAEGDEFADKEKFVTSAYKAQQEEVRRIEEEEAEKAKEEEERRKKGLGMMSFYKDILDRDGKRHEEAVKSAEEAVQKGLVTSKEGEEKKEEEEENKPPQEKSAQQMASELNAKGANIAINDEGEVVDKRQLLSAGLNVAAKPKPAAASRPSGPSSTSRYAGGAGAGRAGGARNAREMQRERQTEMVAAQLEERMRKEKEEEETRQKELSEKNKSKKSGSDVMSAKERYLARKKERENAQAQ